MSENCGSCNKEIYKHVKALTCDGLCGQIFHDHCTKLNETSLRLLKSSPHFFWTCDSCVNKPTGKFVNAFKCIEDDISELKSELACFEAYQLSIEDTSIVNQNQLENEIKGCICRGLPQCPCLISNILSTICHWSFDTFALNDATNGKPIKFIGYALMNRYDLINKFKIGSDVLMLFLYHIEMGYKLNKNPYHNNVHGADIAQTMSYFLNETGYKVILTDIEIFASLIAALAHDYGHTGKTNDFHIMTQSEIAILYNDNSVTENYHISSTFRLMQHDNCNILSNLTSDEYREFRKLFTTMVLGTDLLLHDKQMEYIQNVIDTNDEIENSNVLSLMLHCCDISHGGKDWSLTYRWTMLLIDELFLQGDHERSLGLPITTYCDREESIVGETESNFIENLVEPTLKLCWDIIAYMLEKNMKPTDSKVVFDIMIDNLKKHRPWLENVKQNKQRWKLRYDINLGVKLSTLAALEQEKQDHLNCQ